MSTSSLVRKVEKDALAPVGGGRKFSSFTRARDKEPAEPSWRSKQQGRSQVGEAKDKGKNKFDAVRGDGAGANLLGTMKGGRRLGGKLVRQRSTGDGKGKGGGGKRNESGRGSIGGAAILSLLEAGKQEGAGPRIVAAKSSPWRKLIVSTPVHGEWRAPAEYAAAGSSSSMWGAAGDDDDDDDGPPSTEGEGEMQEDELADVSDGELVYDDEMFVEESLVPRAEQRARSVFSSSNVSSSSAQSPCLRFESRFESGNLRKAYRVGDLEYRLYMRDDVCLSSQGSRVFNCTQWFYFRVLNGLSSKLYTLSLLNFIKPDSLYKDGMQPLLYSREEERRTGKGWHRVGESISYQANVRQFHKNGQVNNFFTLRFSLQLPYDDDECYLAMCYPYTYHDLQRHLLELQSDSLRSQRLRRCELCKTIAGNVLDLVMIGNDLQVKKPSLVITARVHPGESNASLIMHGLLDYLTGPSHHAHELRRAFSFFVVPMLNPDGVILGNYRCSLSGHDLNRQWIEPGEDEEEGTS
uniref:Peptidase M14 domain-containing protein n=1 Tax=Guillardia theta TaxID=55529 RepID=A0A7S4U9J5_GUITH|mmetsp:Transcript_9575/g.32051  ORF Transcript_9575/g.32051 Transcript_9575/m.32051 type:complete len:522 (+) Transcript_9575:75-1640(+)